MSASASPLVTPAALSGAGRLAIDEWLQSLVAAGEDGRGFDGALLDGVPVTGCYSVSAHGRASVAAMPSWRFGGYLASAPLQLGLMRRCCCRWHWPARRAWRAATSAASRS